VGRRSRKRRASVEERIAASSAATAPERPAAAPSRRRPGEPPRPPWHPFPLAELCIFVALVLGVAGFFTGGQRGLILLVGAMVLGSAATLEFTLREHLSGFRSHSVLLAGVVAVACGAGLFVAGLSRPAVIVVAAALFGVAVAGFREIFKRRSGGLGWRGGFR
jgi:hypothetical protein